jgi:predicted nucleic acid-binding protein
MMRAVDLAIRLESMAQAARGREEAEKRGLKVIGALEVIAAAHEDGLLDLAEALGRRLNWRASW